MMGMEYYKNGGQLDPEPGRCRRTDGKKWRCSKEALPDQKYCDKHMHRGRHRSRSAKQVVLRPPPPPAAGGGGCGSRSSGSSSSAGSCNVGGKNSISKGAPSLPLS
ncbi:unnamed protein product [Linum tenue]|uniref:Growth-regulating factor n=1 Tax=Linum tenue TaxID=586396 RepID=A0AAV0JVX5_9ROSI|nr:unnamed protein product [Linum tenue]